MSADEAPRLPPLATIDDLTHDDENANLGTERGRSALAASLRDYGAGRSVLADREGRLIAGNKTIEQGRALGMPIRVIESDGSEIIVVRRTDLDLASDRRARELAYADNRIGQLDLHWSPEQLRRDALDDPQGLPELLFTGDELSDIIAAGIVAPPSRVSPDSFKEYDDDSVTTEHKCPQCGYQF